MFPGRAGGSCPRAPASRAVPGGCPWPAHIVRRAAAGVRGLAQRGSVFEYYVHDEAEPRRNGMYQFCVVGIDVSDSERPVYCCWEPTGRFDRTFTFDEVDRKLAMERYGRSVSVGSRPLGQRPVVDPEAAYRKEGLSTGRVVRWPDLASTDGLLHGELLPDLDERGCPVLSPSCRFPSRNSCDVLGPALWTWHRRFAGVTADGVRQRILVLDGTGRLARVLQFEFRDHDVVAVDDPPRLCGTTLRSHRDRSVYPVAIESALDRSSGVLRYPDDGFDSVVVPFALKRVCNGDDAVFWSLLGEAHRVARELVVLAEEVPLGDEDRIQRWKMKLQAEMRCSVLADVALHGGPVPDHFLAFPLRPQKTATDVEELGGRSRSLVSRPPTSGSRTEPLLQTSVEAAVRRCIFLRPRVSVVT